MRLRLSFVVCVFVLMPVLAQHQTFFVQWNPIKTWNADGYEKRVLAFDDGEYKDESGIPLFSKAVSADGVELSNFHFENFSAEEISIIEASGLSISDSVAWWMGLRTERKSTVRFLQLLPIVKQAGIYRRLTSFDVKYVADAGQPKKVARVSTATSNSVLKSGKWSKIKVPQTGIYKLTSADLKSMGVTASTVRIFGYGGAMLPEDFSDKFYETHDDLPELPLYRGKDYVLFYAQGPIGWSYDLKKRLFWHTTNPYSDAGYYFVTSNAGVAKTISEVNAQEYFNVEVSSFTDYAMHEKDEINLLNSGREFYGELFGVNTSYTFNFSFPNLLNADAKMLVDVVANSPKPSSYKVSADGSWIGSMAVKALVSTNSSYKVAEDTSKVFSFQTSDKGSLSVNLTYEKSTGNSYGYLNYLDVTVQRALKMTGSSLFFRNPKNTGNCKFLLDKASSGIKIWDVTQPDGVFQLPTVLNGSTISFIANNSTSPLNEYVAVNPSGTFPSPEIVGKVDNQNLHGLPQCDMVIIAYPDFMDEARRLADAHESMSGLTVHVVSSEEVYNEFSSGTPDATAYRRLMKMFYDRAVSADDMPKYLLLFGDGHFDNKGLVTNDKSTHCLLTYQSVNSIHEMSSYVTDDYFALLDDGEGKSVPSESMDISVGRFPVSTHNQAKAVVDKTIFYMEDTQRGEWKTKLCFLADDGDNNIHVSEADSVAEKIALKNNSSLIKKIYLDAYKQETSASGERYPLAKDVFLKLVKSGALMVNYTGHGGPTNWTNEQILHQKDIREMYNKSMAFWFTATCNFTRFDVITESGGELLQNNANGGSVALLSAARTVYSSQNYKLNVNLSNYFFEKENGRHLRIGDIVRKAKNKTGEQINKLTFLLFGDPALMLHYPDDYKVETATIDGSTVSGNDTISALGEVTIGGRIVDEAGALVSDFNGYVHVSVFDKNERIATLANDQGSKPFNYSDRPNPLFAGKTEVKGGLFTHTFRVPKDIKYSYGTGRIVYYAADESNAYDASGYFENFIIGGESKNYTSENQGPVVDLYLNTPTFRNGDTVNETPLLVANVEDESGINIVGAGIGHDIMMKMDNDPLTENILNEYYEAELGNYKKGVVVYKLSELKEGTHSLFFRVWDLQNNSSAVTVNFKVEKGLKPVVYSVRCYPNPATDYIYFVYEHDRPDEMLDMTATVYDYTGNRVWSATKRYGSAEAITDPLQWNLKNENGLRVRAGIYVLRMQISVSEGDPVYISSKIIVGEQ